MWHQSGNASIPYCTYFYTDKYPLWFARTLPATGDWYADDSPIQSNMKHREISGLHLLALVMNWMSINITHDRLEHGLFPKIPPSWHWRSLHSGRVIDQNKNFTRFGTTAEARNPGLKKGVQHSSLQSLDQWSCQGKIIDDLAEILFQSFQWKAIVSGSGMGRDVYSLTLSIQHFLCQPQCHQTSKMPWRMVLERLS